MLDPSCCGSSGFRPACQWHCAGCCSPNSQQPIMISQDIHSLFSTLLPVFFFFPVGSGLGICWQAQAASSAKKIKIEVGSDAFLTLELVTCHSTSAVCGLWGWRGVSHKVPSSPRAQIRVTLLSVVTNADPGLLGGTGQLTLFFAEPSMAKRKSKAYSFKREVEEKCPFTKLSSYL